MGLQPIDLANEEERTAEHRDAAAARYWRKALTRAPQAMLRSAGEGVPSRPWARACGSIRASGEGHRRNHRADRGRPFDVLAAYAALIGHAAGLDDCAVTLLSGNRHTPALRGYIGTLVQDALMVSDLRHPTFDALLTAVRMDSLRAYRSRQVDPTKIWEVVDDVPWVRGTSFMRDCVYNNLTGAAMAYPTRLRSDPEVIILEPVRKPSVLTLTVYAWLDFTVIADPRYLPDDYAERFGSALLALLDAATGEPRPLAELVESTGLPRFIRDPDDWVRHDSCWISLSATRKMLAEVLDGADFTLTEDLVCKTAFGDPEKIHAACVAAVPGRRGVMAPRAYDIPAAGGGT